MNDEAEAALLAAGVGEGRVHIEPDVAAGLVLCCQPHPLTERVVLSFDDR